MALAVTGVLYLSVKLALEVRDRELRAKSPPGAQVLPTDPTEVAMAKNRNYRMLLNSVRLLHEIRQHDDLMPSLPSNLRKEIDQFLRDFYD